MDIINMSLTTPYEDLGIKAIIDKAYEKGILVVAASGNSGTITGNTETVLYPAKFPNIIAVSALGQKNSRVTTSSTGREVELSAPGYNIYSTVPGGYGSMTGTSMAAPFVSGLAALYKEKYPSMTNAQIRLLLQKNAKDIGAAGKDRFYGYGLVQADTLKIHPNQNLVTYQAEPDSVVNLNFQPLLQAYTGYNVYRNGQRIIQNGNEPVIQDYGLKGTLQYTVYPVLSGNEQRDKAIVVMANLENPQYQDLSNNLWYTRYMMYLHSEKIVNGYGNILMKPPRLVSRAEAVTMLARALNLDGTKRSTQFTDVPESSFASGYIKSAADLGIVYGLKDKSFKPNEPVTRAEMAILISRGFKLASTQTIAFKDINKSIAGFQEINNLAAANIAEGYMDGTFKPGEKMARYAFSVFLAKAHNEKLKK
jgi:subtilisin